MKRIIRRLFIQIMVLSFAVILSLISMEKYDNLERIKIYEETKGTDVLIGLWSPPAAHAVQDQNSMDQACKDMYDLGARMLITLEEMSSIRQMNRLLDGAEKHNLKVLVYTIGDAYSVTSMIRRTKSHPAVIGYYLKDEPVYDEFYWLDYIFSRAKTLVPDDFLLVGNLLPDYGASMKGQGDYADYVSSFYETVPDANAVFFDSYNFLSTGSDLESLLYTIATNRTVANEKEFDLYPIVQAAAWGPYKTPSLGDLRLQANLSLLFGSKGFIWYYYWVPYDPDHLEEYRTHYSMVTFEGEKTQQWYAVQTVNQEIHNMKGVFLDYEFQGIISHNLPFFSDPFEDVDYTFTEFRELKEIQGEGNILVGCFEKEGKTGLYVMNISSGSPSSAVLQLDGKHDYQIWNSEGLAVLERDSEIALDFEYGEGCFIIIE